MRKEIDFIWVSCICPVSTPDTFSRAFLYSPEDVCRLCSPAPPIPLLRITFSPHLKGENACELEQCTWRLEKTKKIKEILTHKTITNQKTNTV